MTLEHLIGAAERRSIFSTIVLEEFQFSLIDSHLTPLRGWKCCGYLTQDSQSLALGLTMTAASQLAELRCREPTRHRLLRCWCYLHAVSYNVAPFFC